MRIGSCLWQGKPVLVLCEEDAAWIPARAGASQFSDIWTVLDGGASALSALRAWRNTAPALSRVPWPDIKLCAPIPRLRKDVICLGWNYADHLRESAAVQGKAMDIPEHPILFTKSLTAVSGPYDDIPDDPRVTSQLDWEVELGVVIGKAGRHIPQARALEHVLGYCVINDVSARDVQFRHKQYFLGKSIDGTCPMGPWIVTADEIPNPQALTLESRVNGVVKQHSNTQHQIFQIDYVIATLSRHLTLEPGDVIATGTPDGVGFARTPPEYLRAGDVVECEIERIGVIRNRVMSVGKV